MEKKEKILVAGASGALGLEIVRLLNEQGNHLRVLTRSSKGEAKLTPYTNDIWKADASEGAEAIAGITEGVSTVVSALGKSVSLFSPSKKSFYESDYIANKAIIDDAVKNGVKRFVYVSIKGADVKEDFDVAKAHKMVENDLVASGLEYTILRPVGFYSGLNDLAILAKRQLIPVVGDGKAKTNSIHPRDLAVVVVSMLHEGPKLLEVGGPEVHTRLEMAEMVKEKVGGQIVKVPKSIAEIGADIPKIFDEGMHNKLDYFIYVMTHDMVGDKNGNITFWEYLENLDLNELP